MRLVSPVDGRALEADTPHSLTDGTQRWPVADGIAYLRTGREALAAAALERLDAGDRTGALVLLLADQDDWWRGAIAASASLERLVEECGTLSLRQAMRLLEWGPVADYFAHRWSDPTFLAGLALVEAHWAAPRTAFELACGIGHHLRALSRLGVSVTGGDVVFAKLWIARHFVVPDACLVCFDAASPWPVGGLSADLVSCHDAFYFLSPKDEVAGGLRALLAPSGRLAIGHVHNRAWPNFSAGAAVTEDELRALFPRAVLYDDAELTRAAAENRAPVPGPAGTLDAAEAFSLVEGRGEGQGGGEAPRRAACTLVLPPDGVALRRNPLYGADGALCFPSERYAAEYGPRATYGARSECPADATSGAACADWARRRELVDLPARW